MTTKKKTTAPKNGANSPAKKRPKPAPTSNSTEVEQQESEQKPSGASTSDTTISPDAQPATPESLPPESAAYALAVLDAAAAAATAAPASPVAPVPLFGGAGGAEQQLSEAAAMSAASAEPAKRKGGWPKGMPRKPRLASSAGSPASIPTGVSPDTLTLAQARQRIAELEAQNSEQVKVAMAMGFAQISKIGFAIVARRQGVHWYLSNEEAREIGAACGNAALPYVSYIAPALPFIAAVGAVYGAVSSRMEVDLEIEQGKRQRVMPGADNAVA